MLSALNLLENLIHFQHKWIDCIANLILQMKIWKLGDFNLHAQHQKANNTC